MHYSGGVKDDLFFFKIPFCCYNEKKSYNKKRNAENKKIGSAMRSSNYIADTVLKGRKWNINFKLTLRNAINKLQWTGTYVKCRLYYKR